MSAETLKNMQLNLVRYDRQYQYPSVYSNKVNRVTDVLSGTSHQFEWESGGNLMRHMNSDQNYDRRLWWTEDNRLQFVKDNGISGAYYQYDAGGDRTYKLLYHKTTGSLNGVQTDYYTLDDATLYVSPYLVVTPQGYTKHYYAENERITTQLGKYRFAVVDSCVAGDSLASVKLQNAVQAFPMDSFPTPTPMLGYLHSLVSKPKAVSTLYFYHPDHLGSASWITNIYGRTIQHLYYLPWGEDFVNQRTGSFSSMYTFSAKEKDTETGYSYFGSRYYSSDLSIWLSVDPMSAKYPSLSPYVYCADNPVRLVDPDGEKFRLIGKNANIAFRNYLLSYKGVDCMNMYDAFSLAESDPNMIMFKDPNVTYKQFSSNYQKVTGIKLKNKDAKKLFEAIKSDCYIEVKLLSKESISPDCMFDELSHELITGEPAYNAKSLSYNPAVEQIMINIYSDNFNAAFNSCIADYGTSDSKFFFNTTGNNTIINPPKGFMLVNAIGKSAKQAQETLIKELLDFYDELK